jgi:hypothetical protein
MPCPCVNSGEPVCQGPVSTAEHRDFVLRLKAVAERTKEKAAPLRGGIATIDQANALFDEFRQATMIVRRVSFLQHRTTHGQSAQLRAGLLKLEREVLKALQRLA